MRQGQHNNKRMRGRNRKGPNPLNRTYDSNGPDVKIRGNAAHIAEKYQNLARDAQASGDRVTAESYLQHAEHYNRIVAAATAQMQPPLDAQQSDPQHAEQPHTNGHAHGANGAAAEDGAAATGENGDAQGARDGGDEALRMKRARRPRRTPQNGNGAEQPGVTDQPDVAATPVNEGAAGEADGEDEAKPKRRRLRKPKDEAGEPETVSALDAGDTPPEAASAAE